MQTSTDESNAWEEWGMWVVVAVGAVLGLILLILLIKYMSGTKMRSLMRY